MENILLIFIIAASHAADISYMNTTIVQHLSQIRHHVTNPEYKASAREFIYREFQKFGLETEYHNFTTNDNIMGTNVIGVLKGKRFGSLEDKITGVAAHYDTVRNSPGVDDNGSGVAAMLEVARRAGDLNRHNTIIFVSFDLQEDELKGSEKFVAEWLTQFFITNYGLDEKFYKRQMRLMLHGFFILDTIMEYNTNERSQIIPGGFKEEDMRIYFPEIYSFLKSDNFTGDYIHNFYRVEDDDSLADALSMSWESLPDPEYEMLTVPIPIGDVDVLIYFGFQELLRSDHATFWKNYLPALYLTDSGNFRGNMIDCFHAECDNLETMLSDENLKFLGKQADALYHSLHYLAATDCGPPPKIINSVSNVTEEIHTAVYTCTEDGVPFPANSNTNLTCLKSGEWSTISFLCVDKDTIVSGTDGFRQNYLPYLFMFSALSSLILS